jgi:ammonium transporter, Amt family
MKLATVHGEAAYVFGPCEIHDPGYIQGQLSQALTEDAELGMGIAQAVKSDPEKPQNGESSHTT